MHTDEYEISLSRELSVCRNTIKRIRKTLELLEQKHNRTTDSFIDAVRTGTLQDNPAHQEDYEAWQSSCESLKKWQELEKQYEELYKAHKL